jgi:hypothetical protein
MVMCLNVLGTFTWAKALAPPAPASTIANSSRLVIFMVDYPELGFWFAANLR